MCYWTRQYDNLDNRKSYEPVGKLIVSALGHNIHLVGTVGSGGSSCGIITSIRRYNKSAELIGVDTYNSVLFGQPDGQRDLRGLGNTIMPENLVHELFDEIHWVSANDALYYTRQLHKRKALFYGPTTGAAFQVANYLANKDRKKIYVFIAPDEGYRYQDTAYDDSWLKEQTFYNQMITECPIEVLSPLEAAPPWSFLKWNRRKLKDVLSS